MQENSESSELSEKSAEEYDSEEREEDEDASSRSNPGPTSTQTDRLRPPPRKRRSASSGSQTQRVAPKVKDMDGDQSIEYITKLLDNQELLILLLYKMIRYHNEEKKYPYANLAALQDFITNWLQEDVSAPVLTDTLFFLFGRFMKMEQSVLKFVGVPGTHQRQAFDLAYRIWDGVVREGDHAMNKFFSEYTFLLNSLKDKETDFVSPQIEDCPIETIPFVEKKDLEDLEEKWMELRIEETEYYVKRADFMSKQTKLILEAVDQNDNNDGGKEQDLSAFPFLKEWLDHRKNKCRQWVPELHESLIKVGLQLMEKVKLKELDSKWKGLLVEEAMLALKRGNLCKEQVRIWTKALSVIWLS
ncbi:STOREKEEPER protein [Quillaja saponaria]|uniref:STOREKEEPER protein n=1 Tax=Quillaja saponaria TaxID=32244 RepID=A0AAD7KYX2_QUISA|nr:STOREKEEPER protein [Quillaja saponaria]